MQFSLEKIFRWSEVIVNKTKSVIMDIKLTLLSFILLTKPFRILAPSL